MKFEGKTTRFRVIVAKAGDDTTPKGESLTSEDKAHINAMLIPENLKNMRERVTEAVDIAGL